MHFIANSKKDVDQLRPVLSQCERERLTPVGPGLSGEREGVFVVVLALLPHHGHPVSRGQHLHHLLLPAAAIKTEREREREREV